MVELITGMVLLLIARAIFKTREMDTYSQRYNKLSQDNQKRTDTQLETLNKLIADYSQMRKNLKEEIALNRQVTEDAINQSDRAKAALIAVLRTQGCTESQIDEVLQKVEEPER